MGLLKLAGRDSRVSLSTLLIRSGVLSEDEVREANATGMRTGETLGEVVVRKGWATEEAVAALAAKQRELPLRPAGRARGRPRGRLAHPARHGAQPAPGGAPGRRVVVAIARPSRELFTRVNEEVNGASFVVTATSALEAAFASLAPATADAEPEPEPRAAPERTPGEPPAVPDLSELLATIDGALTRLEDARASALALEASLASALGRAAERDSELAEARQAREQDAETIRRLEAELSQRDTRLETFRSELATLTKALDETP